MQLDQLAVAGDEVAVAHAAEVRTLVAQPLRGPQVLDQLGEVGQALHRQRPTERGADALRQVGPDVARLLLVRRDAGLRAEELLVDELPRQPGARSPNSRMSDALR